MSNGKRNGRKSPAIRNRSKSSSFLNRGGVATMAASYQKAGLSVIPIRADGTKAPAINSWKPYQSKRPTLEETQDWFSQGDDGIAIVCGEVSGGLEVLDIDDASKFKPFELLVKNLAPGLWKKLTIVKTPNGYHIYYRCAEVSGNQKLAQRNGSNGDGRSVLIETRGEGGYVVGPGSPADCHSSGRAYRHLSGPPLTSIKTITRAHRHILLNTARSFDEPREFVRGHDRGSKRKGQRPGDKFNRTADWSEILAPHGWTEVMKVDEVTYWRRPEKKKGVSATTGFCKGETSGEMLFVFSTNACSFEPEKAYSKFAALALLEFRGDFGKAARHLARNGDSLSTNKLKSRKIRPHPIKKVKLQDGLKVFEKWLYLTETVSVEIILSILAGNQLPSDPLWLMIVDAPGSGKTELFRSFTEHPSVVFLSSMTTSTLISGYTDDEDKDHDPSLLPKLDGKVLVIKDFTTILSMPRDRRAELFGQFRDAFDGESGKAFGTAVGIRSYKSKFNLLAAVTPEIERKTKGMQQLGERFLRLRFESGDARKKIERALGNANREQEMRMQLAAAARGMLANALIEVPKCTQEFKSYCIDLAHFLSVARTEVTRDGWSKEVAISPQPEVGTRVAKKLLRLAQGLAMLRRRKSLTREEFAAIRRVAFDSLPSRRRIVIRYMYENREEGGMAVDSIASKTRFPKTTITYELEDMQMLKIVKKTTRKPASTSMTKRRTAKSSRVIYRLTKEFLDLLDCIEKGPSA